MRWQISSNAFSTPCRGLGCHASGSGGFRPGLAHRDSSGLFLLKRERVDVIAADILHDQRRIGRVESQPGSPPSAGMKVLQVEDALGTPSRPRNPIDSTSARPYEIEEVAVA